MKINISREEIGATSPPSFERTLPKKTGPNQPELRVKVEGNSIHSPRHPFASKVKIASQYFVFTILSALLTSCASSIAISRITDVPQGESLVFGQVKVISEGKPVNWSQRELFKQPPGVFHIAILAHNDLKLLTYQLSGDDGSFYWHLPPGDYKLTGFHWISTTGDKTIIRPILAQFVVSAGESITYIGTLTISFEAERYSMRVEDEYEHGLFALKGKFPGINASVAKSLMNLEKMR